MNRLADLICQFRTYQLRRFTFPAGMPIWCRLALMSSRPDHLVPGETTGRKIITAGDMRMLTVRLFRESPLGTQIDTVCVDVERISYRRRK